MPSASETSQSVCDRIRRFNDPHAYPFVIGSASFTLAWRTNDLQRLADRMERHGDETGAAMLRAQAVALSNLFSDAMDTLDRINAADDDDETEAEAA